MTILPILPDDVTTGSSGHLATHDALADFYNSWLLPDQSGYYQPTDFISIGGIVVPRVTTITSNATWAINANTTDMFVVTAQAVNVTSIPNPTGTPQQGQMLLIRVKDSAGPHNVTWTGAQWRASTDLAIPTATQAGKTTYLAWIWNDTDGFWDLLSVLKNF